MNDPQTCWLLVDPEAVPPTLQSVAVPMAMVPLLSTQARRLLEHEQGWRSLEAEDRSLAAALTAGRPLTAIAREMGVTTRTVERRLADLRDRFNAGSTAELIAELSRLGF